MKVVEMRAADGVRCLAQWIWLESSKRWSLVHSDALLSEPEKRAVKEVRLARSPDPKGVEMQRQLMGFRWYLLDCDPDFDKTRRTALDETTQKHYSVRRGKETGTGEAE